MLGMGEGLSKILVSVPGAALLLTVLGAVVVAMLVSFDLL
jgi:hypothetical protein